MFKRAIRSSGAALSSIFVILTFALLFVGPLLAEAAEGGGPAGKFPANTASSWPIYHGDSGLKGMATCKLPDQLSVIWRYKVGSPVSLAPVSDGKRIFVIAESGEAFAISLKGEKEWSATIKQDPAGTNVYRHIEKFLSPPLVIQNTVFTGSDIGYLHALDSDTGKMKWKYRAGESINGTANWIEPEGGRGTSVVIISQADSVLHRIDLETGTPIWVTQRLDRSDGSPGVGKDFVAFGNCEAALFFFSIETGKIAGRVKLNEDDGQVAGGIAVEDNLVFAGTRGGLVVCADVKKARIVWSNQVCNSECFATPVIAGDRIITSASDGKVYCLNRADGKLLWQFKAGGDSQSPVVAGGKVVVSSGGTLFILKLEDGAKLWADKPGDAISSPAVFGGRIVVGTDDGFVVMYGERI